jgi:hypothetical protein
LFPFALPILPVRESCIDSDKRRKIETIKFHVRWLDQVRSSHGIVVHSIHQLKNATGKSRHLTSKGAENAMCNGCGNARHSLLLTFRCRFPIPYLSNLNEAYKMTFGRLPTFAAIVAAGLFIAATLHHSRDNLKVPDAIKSWTFQKSAFLLLSNEPPLYGPVAD